MRIFCLAVMSTLAVVACDTDSVAPVQEDVLSTQESAVLTERAARRSARFDRLLDHARGLDDPDVQELLTQLESTRDAARAAMEAGDRESAREIMAGARETMLTLRGKLFPDAPDNFRGQSRGFRRQARGERGVRFQNLADRIRSEGSAGAQQLLAEALVAKEQADVAKEAGDTDAARAHMQEFRSAMHDALELTFPEGFERMREHRGKRQQR